MTASRAHAADGDRDAHFERQMLTSLPEVARFALSLTRDAADADDLVQETMLRAYRFRHTFRQGEEPRRWLFTICRNAFRRRLRREAPFVDADPGDPETESLAFARAHVDLQRRGEDDLLDRIDIGPAIDRAVGALPASYRVAVVLIDMEGLTYQEAADIERVPVGTVRSRLFRARRLLQEALLAHARDAGLAPALPPDTIAPGHRLERPMPLANPIDCATAVRRMWDSIDGALDDARRAEVEAHLAECEQCPPHFTFARRLRRHIAAARLDHADPETLRRRLAALLEAHETRQQTGRRE